MSNIVSSSSAFTLDAPTILSVVFALSLGPAAQLLANFALPGGAPRSTYFLFIWHAYDALTHFTIEACYLYHCFFSYDLAPQHTADYPHPASLSSTPVPHFLGYNDRRYGPNHGSGATARLWQEYAKADKRWGEADLTVISLEILTVFLAGPAAAYICYLLYQISNTSVRSTKSSKANIATLTARLHLTATILATGELYGGFMTFNPEWLSGSVNLDTSNPAYLWLYLVFFNVLWVFVPIAIIWWVWGEVGRIYSAVPATVTSPAVATKEVKGGRKKA